MAEESKSSPEEVDIRAKAKEYIEWEPYPLFKKQASDALKENKKEELEKMFGKRIAFGTAGLRSFMGGGYANMNDLIIIQTSQGLLRYVEKHVKDAKSRGIVLAYDAS